MGIVVSGDKGNGWTKVGKGTDGKWYWGGCSPLGMKKAFPTIIDASAKQYEDIYVSGGRIGTTIRLHPLDLARVVKAEFAPDLMLS